MLKWLNKLFDKSTSSDDNHSEFLKFVRKQHIENSSERFCTWSSAGFNLTMEILLDRLQYDLKMLIEKRELFFDSIKLMKLEEKLKEFQQKELGKVTIITFNGESDSEFEKFKEKYPSVFEYIAISCNNKDQVNNFVIVDNKSYLLEDTILHRNTINDVLKAEVNFFDFSKSAKLVDNFNKYLEIALAM